MPRRVQDIIPSEKRSIRNIPLERDSVRAKPDRTRESHIQIHHPIETKPEPKKEAQSEKVREVPLKRLTTETPARKSRNKKKTGWVFLLLGLIVLIAGAGFIASAYFSRATFTIIPKVVPISINSTYLAASVPTTGMLTYSLVAFKSTASSTLSASEGTAISSKAQGKITLYNNFSNQSQRLIAGTRLSDDKDRIYRLVSSISIPGSTTSTKGTLPGSIAATIIADQPGQSYNVSKADPISDLKVTSYKGTTKYSQIYGRISTDISGGFSGTKKIVNPTLLASTTALLQQQVTTSALTDAKSHIPPEYIFYENAYVTSFGTATVTDAGTGKANVSAQGTLYAILFKKSDLIARLATPATINTFGRFGYTAPDIEKLDFVIGNAKDFSPEKKGTLAVRLKGAFKIIGAIPVEEIKKLVTGAPLAQTENILHAFDAVIESGEGELVPPWSKVPTDPSRITVVVKNP